MRRRSSSGRPWSAGWATCGGCWRRWWRTRASAWSGWRSSPPTRPGRGRLALTPADERARVVREWNRTEAALPAESCIHGLFEAQVERTPDAVAVVYAGEQLTYAELDRRANRLAHHLRRRGVGPEDRVALCMERSLELMVAFFGILKAGAAYVPLEPTHPADRLTYTLEDSGARLLISQSWLMEGLPEARPETLFIDRMAE